MNLWDERRENSIFLTLYEQKFNSISICLIAIFSLWQLEGIRFGSMWTVA